MQNHFWLNFWGRGDLRFENTNLLLDLRFELTKLFDFETKLDCLITKFLTFNAIFKDIFDSFRLAQQDSVYFAFACEEIQCDRMVLKLSNKKVSLIKVHCP